MKDVYHQGRPSRRLTCLCLLLLAASIARGGDAKAVGNGSASFADFDRRARVGEPITVVFFGGSLTYGTNASRPCETSYRGLMAEYLRTKYPKTSFRFVDAAIGGTGSRLAMFRLERDVLAYKPDLVFLDFTANDGLAGHDPYCLASYEGVLRDLIERNIPVVQLIFGFHYNFGKRYHPESQHRRTAHRNLSDAYDTGLGDLFPMLQALVEKGELNLDEAWPFDPVHPDDPGYRVFFEVAREGLETAIAEKKVCRLTDAPFFSDSFDARRRIRLVDGELPKGWKRAKTFRTSLWFDGLSSRWMGDVAVCDAKDKGGIEPIRLSFEGTFVGVLGEADEKGLGFVLKIDGTPVAFHPRRGEPTPVHPFNRSLTRPGRLLVWHIPTQTLAPGKHTLELSPSIPDGVTEGQLRIESLCVAGEGE